MNTYQFRSVRGSDLLGNGDTPEEAYQELVERLKEKGVLWRLHDRECNKFAVKNLRFKPLDPTNLMTPVYKQVK